MALANTKEEKRTEREARELARRLGQKRKPVSKGYLYYMIFIICIIYIADEVTSQIGTQMQSVLSQALFAPVFGEEMALARMSALGSLSVAGSALAMLYKPLSDRYGRKPFLIINTLGMGLGLLFVGVSTSIPVYLIGGVIIAFFIPHDMQAVYIFEMAPPKYRATMYSVIKSVATLGVMLIPLLRNLLMKDPASDWRKVYLLCAVFGAVAALIALILARESDVFLDHRIAYLRMSEEEKTAQKQKKDGGGAQGGLFAAMKFCLKHRQLRWLILSSGFLYWGMAMTTYYEKTMTNGYAAQFLNQGMSLTEALGSATPFVTQALFLFPVGSALFQLIQGFVADKWGRKPAAILMCACSIFSYLLFFVGANHGWTPYAVGFLCGAAVGSYWAAGDIVGSIMPSEAAPTNLRSSVLTAFPICSVLIGVFGVLGAMIALNVLGDAKVGVITLGVAVPGMVLALLILCFKTHETKQVDIGKITGEEWDA